MHCETYIKIMPAIFNSDPLTKIVTHFFLLPCPFYATSLALCSVSSPSQCFIEVCLFSAVTQTPAATQPRLHHNTPND